MTNFTLTECKLCHKQFEIPADLNVPPLPEPVSQRLMNLIANHLVKHISKKHPEAMTQVNGTTQDMFGLSILTHFTHEDQTLLRRMNQTRAQFHRAVGTTIDDATLQDRIARLGLSNGDGDKVLRFCQELRAVLTEQDAHL